MACRGAEQAAIANHLRAALVKGGSEEVLYISGVPGTGKTACVLQVISEMDADQSMPRFQLVHVNAMRLGAPQAVFVDIHSQLCKGTGRGRCAAAAATGELTALFSERQPGDPVTVLLVDEVDQLVTRSQAVLYRLFEWLALPSPRLVLMAISNTMDLPERMLPKVASRFEVVRVDFRPYSRDEIQQILKERLEQHSAGEAFMPMTLKRCAARVAAGSGDIRKALQLCRWAVEVRQRDQTAEGPVDMRHLEAAEKDLLHVNPMARYVRGLAAGPRRLLLALVLELRQCGEEVVPLKRLVARYTKIRQLIAAESGEVASGDDFFGLVCQQQTEALEVSELAARLEAASLLRRQQGPQQARLDGEGPLLSLCCDLEVEDIAGVLAEVEQDPAARELLGMPIA